MEETETGNKEKEQENQTGKKQVNKEKELKQNQKTPGLI